MTKDLIGIYGHVVTLEVAAQIANIHPETVRRAYRRGAFPAYRIGRCVRVSMPKLVAWMDAGGEDQYKVAKPSVKAPATMKPLKPGKRPAWMAAAELAGV